MAPYSTFKKGSNDGLVPKPSADKTSAQYLNADGTWTTPPNTTYSNMTGATSSAAGKAGLVPAPASGVTTKYLRSDGTWSTPPDTNTTYSDFSGASTSAVGARGLVPAPAKNTTLSYLKSTGNWDSALTALDETGNNDKLVTNKGIRDGITNAINGLVSGITQSTSALNSFKVSFKSGADQTITINDVVHAASADKATSATLADKATKLTTARKIGAVTFDGSSNITFKEIGFTAYTYNNGKYYGINWDGTTNGAAEDWYLRPPQSNADASKDTLKSKNSGFLPIVEGSLGNGHSSLGKSDWYFKNSYVDNSYVQKVNFGNGSASIQYDTTNKCINFVFS